MNAHEIPAQLRDKDLTREGMYLLFPDGQTVDIVPGEIDRLAEEYWKNPEKIHPQIKQLKEFQPCGHCPHFGEDVLCLALKPILPYLEHVDNYMSYDNCVAVYCPGDGEAPQAQETTVQQALRYVAILSLIHYCEMGGRYRRYFQGVNPMMGTDEMSRILYRNIQHKYEDDGNRMEEMVTEFEKEVLESTQCLTTRLKLMCKNDAFINAFINAETAIKFVLMDCQNRNIPGTEQHPPS